MEAVMRRARALIRTRARASKIEAANERAAETENRRRELSRRGLLPPARAADVAAREMARGNWRPPF